MTIPSRVQTLLMTTLPHGGQRTARRNAWAGTSAGAARARDRREAERAIAAAGAHADRRLRTGS